MKFRSKIFILAILVIIITLTGNVIAYEEKYERSETLVYGGGLWTSPTNWNPLTPWEEVTGTSGLVYERLFHYYPLEGEYQPWLAENGEWVAENIFELELRKGIQWTDGETFDARDVVFTFELAKENEELYYADAWDWINDITVLNSHKIRFVFSEPHHQQWNQLLSELSIIPRHIWDDISDSQLLTTNNENPVGTGPYVVEEVADDYIVWERNENWWGKETFGTPTPRYLVNIIVAENHVALGMLMKGELDLSNFFTPGVPELKRRYDLETWYEDSPYMLPHNTSMLFFNTLIEPMDDPDFRWAAAYAIDRDAIVTEVYDNQVEASNPTGLFGTDWMTYYNEEAVEDHGFSYDPKMAERILRINEYRDRNGDGWRQTPDGNDIELDIIVPYGWTDWMDSIRIIAENLQEIGINANARFPDVEEYEDRLYSAEFDMAINNYGSIRSGNPYTYWDWVANSNINQETVTEGNFGRYNNPELFELITTLNTYRGNESPAREAAKEIQEILLRDIPSVPLWHNGMWAQSTTEYWENWPTENNPTGYPSTWSETWQFGAIEMLINLEKAK